MYNRFIESMKIPKEAKRVFEGIIYDTYQWKQKMFDGSYKTFEMLKRRDSVEVIATCKNKIYIGFQSQPVRKDFYCFFGGRVEHNEDPLATAKRELLEEGGMVSDEWELWKMYESDHNINWYHYIYIARNAYKTGEQMLDSGEKIEIREVTFDEFVNLLDVDNYYWGTEFLVEMYRMKQQGKLNKFKEKLFSL